MARVAGKKVSGLVGKLETEVHIKASAREFYDMFAERLYLVSHTIPDIIQGIDLLDGEWGTADSIHIWNYVQDGKAKVMKNVLEAVDPEKKLITYRFLDGDVMEDFKNFAVTLQVTPKPKGLGSIAHWYIEYEKISEEVAPPEAFLQLGVLVIKEIDKHL